MIHIYQHRPIQPVDEMEFGPADTCKMRIWFDYEVQNQIGKLRSCHTHAKVEITHSPDTCHAHGSALPGKAGYASLHAFRRAGHGIDGTIQICASNSLECQDVA